MTRAQRAAIIATIEANTDYDIKTVVFHRDGGISAILDADKTFNGPETVRKFITHVKHFSNGANPFCG